MGLQRLGFVLVLLLAWATLGCARGSNVDRPRQTRQATTTYSFSIVSGALPRVLFMGRERGADLVVRNDGFNTWEGRRKFFLAPAWLGVRGAGVVDQGFRTPIPERVLPGDEVALRARVRTPRGFGFYRVQWDLLSEESGWFATYDRTPEPLRWVLVLPPVEFILAVLVPCLLIGIALLAGRRGEPTAPGLATIYLGLFDLVWCGASLLGKPYLLYAELLPKFWPGPRLITFSVVSILLLSLYYLPPKARSIAAWSIAALGAFLAWAQVIYFRFFLDLASSVAFFAGRQATDLGDTIGFLAKPTDFWLILDLLFVIPVLWLLSGKRTPLPARRKHLPAIVLWLLAVPFVLSGFKALSTGQLDTRRNLQNLRSVSNYGLYGFQLLDAGARLAGRWTRAEVTPDEFDRVLSWFEETRAQRQASGPTAGVARGLNLVAIQVESMQEFVVDLDIDGTPVMPNLRRLRESAFEFTQVLDQTSRGRSSAGDFVAMTSLLPIGESIAYEHPENDYYGIGHALAENGYSTLSAIPYKGSFWNRQTTHPAYGFQTNLFRSDFERHGPRVGWGINDQDFLEQTVPKLDSLEEPFFAWLTTLSVHYPYDSFPATLKKRSMGDLEGTRLGNYLHGMSLFDRALGEFFGNLEHHGLLDRTVVAIWGDHGSGLVRDPDFTDYFELDSPVKRFLFDRVPFMIWLPPGLATREVGAVPAGQIDVAPTLLALMGIEPGNIALMGRNLLLDSIRGPVAHPQGKWFDPELVFLSQFADGEGSACWSARTLKPLPHRRCAQGSIESDRQLETVALVLQHDLQGEISRRLASQARQPE